MKVEPNLDTTPAVGPASERLDYLEFTPAQKQFLERWRIIVPPVVGANSALIIQPGKVRQRILRFEMTQRMVETARLFMEEGLSLRDMSAKLGRSRESISSDLNKILYMWQIQIGDSVEFWVARELTTLARVESEAWAAWEQSLQRKGKIKRVSYFRRGKDRLGRGMPRMSPGTPPLDRFEDAGDERRAYKEEHILEEATGDPRYLDLIRRIVEQRAMMMGLNRPIKIAPTDPSGEEPYGISDPERAQRIAAILDSARARRDQLAQPGGEAEEGSQADELEPMA
jgi:hypothetical protein